jgi:hypothetical protein
LAEQGIFGDEFGFTSRWVGGYGEGKRTTRWLGRSDNRWFKILDEPIEERAILDEAQQAEKPLERLSKDFRSNEGSLNVRMAAGSAGLVGKRIVQLKYSDLLI